MYLGRIVEHGPVQAVLQSPQHPYTNSLLSAVPVADPTTTREVIRLEGELPSPVQSAGRVSLPSALPRGHAPLSRQLPLPNRVGKRPPGPLLSVRRQASLGGWGQPLETTHCSMDLQHPVAQ